MNALRKCTTMVVPCVLPSWAMLHIFPDWTILINAVGTFRGRDCKMLNNSKSTSCSMFCFALARTSVCKWNIRWDITLSLGRASLLSSWSVLFDQRLYSVNHGRWSFLSQILCRRKEKCTVMRSLSSVIQDEVFSGSLTREIIRGKMHGEYPAHLI